MIWRARQHQFTFPGRVLYMGILNVTPDSFSDGGQFFDTERAVEHGNELISEGADILDIGGESSRPGATPVNESEELRRVLPVISALHQRIALPLSIDTQKPAVARAAINAGASIINDIGSNRQSTEMWDLAAQSGCGYVLMHMAGNPQTMHLNPQYDDVVAEVGAFFAERLEVAKTRRVPLENVALDPGIGFGKTAEHNLQLLAELSRFKINERPLLLGASRKSFIGRVLGGEANERLQGSVACAVWAALHGVQIIRTHDVRATRQAVRMIEEIAARRQKC